MHDRDGDQEIATGIAHQGLDVPLLVGPADPAEVGLEEVVALESLEGVGERRPRPSVILVTAIFRLS